MIDVNIITLEDEKEYMIIDTVHNESGQYLILASENEDLCVRKITMVDGKECLEKLDSEEEYGLVMKSFNMKHNRKEGNNEE